MVIHLLQWNEMVEGKPYPYALGSLRGRKIVPQSLQHWRWRIAKTCMVTKKGLASHKSLHRHMRLEP